MSPDHITAGAYNRYIDKRLARKLVCATRDYVAGTCTATHAVLMISIAIPS